ncbi:MAG: nucleotidyltransferase domain-containing protein [Chloroherpetonaceae bacterium]|nr:nucleotidyltransferase domain-containing protein [Chloroherpetonaceae bacterium]
MRLPNEKQYLIDRIVEALRNVDGVKAIVLGGSYAVGMQSQNSDLDIGIYYQESNPFDIDKIRVIANHFAHQDPPTVTDFYGWGPWVNGGAWINTNLCKVDFIYKNIDQISLTIQNAINGIWENNFEQQPPYGFSSIIFLAETHYCIPLFDTDGIITKLKDSVKEYPQKLKRSVIQQSLWSAEFTIIHAQKFADKNDIYNTVGCLTRTTKCIVTSLFALNELYPLGDKRALNILENAKTKPENLTLKIDSILSCTKNSLSDNVKNLKLLFQETVSLSDGFYHPSFKL